MFSKVALTAIVALCSTSLFGEVVYSTLPANTSDGTVTSLGYDAQGIAEFGNAITLAGTNRNLTTVEVLMTNDALFSTWGGNPAGYTPSLTLNLYTNSVNAAAGTAFATLSFSPTINWADPAIISPENPLGRTTTLVTFDFSSQNITLPNTLIYGLSFKTSATGAPSPGPYDSLNFACDTCLATGNPSTGTNVSPDNAYVNVVDAAAFESSINTQGTFALDTNGAYGAGPNVEFDAGLPAATPEPGTFVLLGGALLLLGITRRGKPTNSNK